MTRGSPLHSLTEFIFPSECAHISDVALVFGSRHHIKQIANRVVELWGSGLCRHVIFSGYEGEARKIAGACISLGLPESAIHLEVSATNTFENVERSLGTLQRLSPSRSVVCIAKQHALARALLTTQLRLPDWTISAAAVNYWGVDRDNWHENFEFVSKVREELLKLPGYIEAGHVSQPDSRFGIRQLILACPAPEAPSSAEDAISSLEIVSSLLTSGPAFEDLRPVSLHAEVTLAGARTLIRTGILERPDAVACVLYSREDDAAVLVEQFRGGPYLRDGSSGLSEIVAGYIDDDEMALEAVRREILEETGIVPDELFPIMKFYPAPTISREVMHLWCGITKQSVIGGSRTNIGNEYLNVKIMPLPEVESALLDGRISNALSVIGLSWLVQNRGALRLEAIQ